MQTQPDLDGLATAYRILEAHGQADGMLGHVSLRDPNGGFWMKRADVGLDEVRGAGQLLLLGFDGARVVGEGPIHTEWPIHAAVFLARPDAQSVVHTHAQAASLLSAQAEALSPLTTEGGYFADRPVPFFTAPSAQITDMTTAAAMATTLGDGVALLLRNHGLVTTGMSLAQAVLAALFLERAAHQQLTAAASGLAFTPATVENMAERAAMLHAKGFLAQSFAYHARRLARA